MHLLPYLLTLWRNTSSNPLPKIFKLVFLLSYKHSLYIEYEYLCNINISITDSMNMSLSIMEDKEAWSAVVRGVINSWT